MRFGDQVIVRAGRSASGVRLAVVLSTLFNSIVPCCCVAALYPRPVTAPWRKGGPVICPPRSACAVLFVLQCCRLSSDSGSEVARRPRGRCRRSQSARCTSIPRRRWKSDRQERLPCSPRHAAGAQGAAHGRRRAAADQGRADRCAGTADTRASEDLRSGRRRFTIAHELDRRRA